MSAEDELKDLLAYLLEASAVAAQGSLDTQSEAANYLPHEDRAIVASARRELHADGQTMRTIVGTLRSAEHSEYRLSALVRFTEAVIDISSRTIMTEPTWRYVKRAAADAQAEAARQALSEKREADPREKVIQAEIDREVERWDGAHSSKLGGIISQRLQSDHGIKIGARAVRDRLEKWKLFKSFNDENGSA